MSKTKPKVLLLDIETSPIISYTWGLFDQNVALNQIKQDWHVLSFAAKWLNEPANKMIYHDQRHSKDITNDKKLLQKIWNLIDEADIVIAQNGNSFDIKKLNARFVLNGLQPPSSYKKIDTKLIAKKYFAFTSNKLEYMTDKMNKKYKKLKHSKFPGFELWTECLKGNLQAWKEIELYNKFDVLALEELYNVLAPWDTSSAINWNLYHDDEDIVCKCGRKEFKSNGFAFTATGKFQRYKCKHCGHETRSRQNLFSKEKKKSLRA